MLASAGHGQSQPVPPASCGGRDRSTTGPAAGGAAGLAAPTPAGRAARSNTGRLLVPADAGRLSQNGQLIGIVSNEDLLNASPSQATSLSIWEVNYLLSQLRVDEIMTPRPVTISVDDTLGEAAQLMLKHRIGGLPVVDRHGALAVIITECDIFRLVVEDWLQEAEPAAGI